LLLRNFSRFSADATSGRRAGIMVNFELMTPSKNPKPANKQTQGMFSIDAISQRLNSAHNLPKDSRGIKTSTSTLESNNDATPFSGLASALACFMSPGLEQLELQQRRRVSVPTLSLSALRLFQHHRGPPQVRGALQDRNSCHPLECGFQRAPHAPGRRAGPPLRG
jgi:hypothetical protein